MQKVLTVRGKEVRQARVYVVVFFHDPSLQAAIDAAVLAAIDAWRGSAGEQVVHMRDARNRVRSQDTPPPGRINDGGQSTDPGPGDDEEGQTA